MTNNLSVDGGYPPSPLLFWTKVQDFFGKNTSLALIGPSLAFLAPYLALFYLKKSCRAFVEGAGEEAKSITPLQSQVLFFAENLVPEMVDALLKTNAIK